MKKTVFALVFMSLMNVISCTKESGNKGVIKEDTAVRQPDSNIDKTTVAGSNDYTYRGLQGVRAKVTFNNSDKDNTLVIKANNKQFELDKKSSENGEVQYERAGIKALVKGDSIIVEQDGNVIPLVWDN